MWNSSIPHTRMNVCTHWNMVWWYIHVVVNYSLWHQQCSGQSQLQVLSHDQTAGMKHNICTMPSDQCKLVQQYDEEFSSRPASDLEWRTARRNPQWWSAQAVTHVFFHDIKSFSYIIVPHTIFLSKCLFFTNFRKCSCLWL